MSLSSYPHPHYFYNVYVDRATRTDHRFGMQPRTRLVDCLRAVKEDEKWLLAYRIVCHPRRPKSKLTEIAEIAFAKTEGLN